jgi:hypothetical protein
MDESAKYAVPARGAPAAFLVVALLGATPAAGEVVDEITIERHDSAARVRVRLTAPVHYLRHAVSADGAAASIYLQALAPASFDGKPFPDEVKHSRANAAIPGFTVRVNLDPRCEPAPNPICIVVRFERAVRYEIRLGEDRRSLLLDFPPKSEGEGGPPTAREKP